MGSHLSQEICTMIRLPKIMRINTLQIPFQENVGDCNFITITMKVVRALKHIIHSQQRIEHTVHNPITLTPNIGEYHLGDIGFLPK